MRSTDASFVVPAEARAETQDPDAAADLRRWGVWVPAFAGTTARVLRIVCLSFPLISTATGVLAEDVQVTIDNFTFNPQTTAIKAGTTVTWTNRDDIPHTVVSPPTVRSRALDTGQSFSFTFAAPGTYKYFCSLHPHMTGTIVVEAAKSAGQ